MSKEGKGKELRWISLWIVWGVLECKLIQEMFCMNRFQIATRNMKILELEKECYSTALFLIALKYIITYFI